MCRFLLSKGKCLAYPVTAQYFFITNLVDFSEPERFLRLKAIVCEKEHDQDINFPFAPQAALEFYLLDLLMKKLNLRYSPFITGANNTNELTLITTGDIAFTYSLENCILNPHGNLIIS